MRSTSFVVLGLLSLGGCASIIDGSTQVLSVETRREAELVNGASCQLTNNKGTWYVTTPGTVAMHRSYDDLNVKCDKPGSEPGIATVSSSTRGMTFGNILVGGIIGAAVDMGSGAAYDYPTLITVSMGAEKVVTPPATPAAGPLAVPGIAVTSATFAAPVGMMRSCATLPADSRINCTIP